MDAVREFHLLALALREGLVRPNQLAENVLEWTPDHDPSVIHYLSLRGILARESIRHLESLEDSRNSNGSAKPDPSRDATVEAPSTPRPGVTPGGTVETVEYSSGHPAESNTLNTAAVPRHPRYEIVRMHGAGGLGKVWLANDRIIGRQVAMKTIREDRQARPQVRERFLKEARVTGQLDHPNIPAVFDLAPGGENRPAESFYTMRFLEGKTLADAVDAYHTRRAAGEAKPVDFARLLNAFATVGQAIAYSHSREVIHRDLKDQNVVLGDYGEVFLVDWGLGKKLGESTEGPDIGDTDPETGQPSGEGTGPTLHGSIVGTPAYMSPEVARGEPATKASDIFGLGAILYRILSGKAPAVGRNARSIIEAAALNQPTPIRDLNPEAPPALVAVCAKATATTPGERYASAAELAADVNAYLADQPLMVFRDPFTTRALRWAKGHRTFVVSAGVLLATIAVATGAGAAVVWKEQKRTESQRLLAVENYQQAEAQRSLAADNFRLAKGVSMDNFRLIEADEARFVSDPGLSEYRRKVFDSTSLAMKKAVENTPDDPQLLADAAKVFRFTANMHRFHNRHAEAAELYVRADGLHEKLTARSPADGDALLARSELLQAYSAHHVFLGGFAEAKAKAVLAAELAAKAGDVGGPSPRQRRIQARAGIDLADIAYQTGDFDTAVKAAESAGKLFDALAAKPESNVFDTVFAAMAETIGGRAERAKGNLAAAEKLHLAAMRRMIAFAPQIEAKRDVPGGLGYVDAAHQLTQTVFRRCETQVMLPSEKKKMAEDNLGKSIATWQTLADKYPEAPQFRYFLAEALLLRGILFNQLQKPAEAKVDFERAVVLCRKLRKDHPAIPDYAYSLAKILAEQAEAGDAKLLAEAKAEAAAAVEGMPGQHFVKALSERLGKQ